jgi:hypothetical protein
MDHNADQDGKQGTRNTELKQASRFAFGNTNLPPLRIPRGRAGFRENSGWMTLLANMIA